MTHLTRFFEIDSQTKDKLISYILEETDFYAMEYLPTGVRYGLLIGLMYYLVITAAWFGWKRLVQKERPTGSKWLCRRLPNSLFLAVLVAYVYVCIGISVFCREPGSRQSLNLTLFSTFQSDFMSRIYVFENILMFIPLGILLPLVWRKLYRFPWCVLIGTLGSIAIEVTQYQFSRGYSQLDDILNNTIGALIGYWIVLLCHGCAVLWRKWREK